MAISRVQSVTNEQSGPTLSNTLAISAPPANSLIVSAIGGDKNIGADFAVPTGFTLLGTLMLGSGCSFGFAFKISAGETAIVWNYGGAGATGDNTAAWVGVYTGNTATPFDVSAETNSTSTAVASISSGTTAATAQNDEIAIVAGAVDSVASIPNPAWNNSFVAVFAGWFGTNAGIFIGEKTLVATGTQQSTLQGSSGTDQMGAAIATFKAAAVAASTPPRNLLLNIGALI